MRLLFSASAKKNDMRLISVVMGAIRPKIRVEETKQLLPMVSASSKAKNSTLPMLKCLHRKFGKAKNVKSELVSANLYAS